MTLTNKWYDALKWLVTVVLPAFSALYFTLAQIWEWDNAEQVVGTIAAITTFLGATLMFSSSNYKGTERSKIDAVDGVMRVETDPGGTIYSLEPTDDDLENLGNQEYVTFRVQR